MVTTLLIALLFVMSPAPSAPAAGAPATVTATSAADNVEPFCI